MAAFSSLTDRLSNAFKHLKSKGKLSEADIDGTIREIRRALLDADVALDVVRSFTGRIRERALGTEVSEALNPAQQVVKIVNEELTAVLGAGVDRPLNFAKNPPTIIMLAGLQGAGKTTLAGKLGYWLKDSGHTPLLVAADLQRPNAVTQLQVVGERAGVPVYAPEKGVQSDGGEAVVSPGQTTGDPVKVARDAVELAKQKLYDTVIIDTAGRLGVDEELMKQARDIRDAVQPNEILFVIDAMIGQDAVQTAKAFDEGVDFTGVVLSKLDGDARGGAALSVASVTGKPILFASTGEGLKDFEVFHPDRMASRILDMGDILTLIEQAQKQFDEEEARKAAVKISDGSFGLDDFLDQLQQVRKLGPMKNLLGMIPGMAAHRKELEQFDEREIDRTEAIIRSMTPAERRDPSIIDGSRRARIAYGSGVTVSQVNALLQRFDQAAKMMRRMSNKVGAGVPGFGGPAMGGGKGKGKGKKNKKKSGKSGNPMKREAEEKALRDKLAGKASGGASSGGSAPRSRRIRRFLPDCRICWAIPASCRRTWVVACPVCCTKPRYVRLPAITTTGNRNTAYITKLPTLEHFPASAVSLCQLIFGLFQRQRGGQSKMIGTVDREGAHVGCGQTGGEQDVVEDETRPRQPRWERGAAALRLGQRGVLEAGVKQLAEARMVGTGVEVAQYDGDIALLLRCGQLTQADDAGGPVAAAAHRRFRMGGNESDAAHRINREAHARHVGGGNHGGDRRRVAWLDANPNTVEAAVVRIFVLP